MTNIRVTCQSCGAVTGIRPDQILLLADPDQTAGGYLFLCTSCERLTVRPAGPADLEALIAAGVRDAREAGRSTGRSPQAVELPPLTRDDLLDFHLLLATDEWFSQLA
jgi:hypothetical protein